jgi:NADH:ubiquinone oxidoreductase subunit F (NADH-binding)
MSIPLRTLIEEHCGGVVGGWGNLQGDHPWRLIGAADPEAEICDTVLDGLRRPQRLKSGLGTAARDRDG